MEKIVIYTCITGGYDSLQQPCLPPDGFEFICFVKQGTRRAEYDGVWKIEELPFDWDDRIILARGAKLNPQTVLPEDIGWSLWIDGNIRITGDSIYNVCISLQERDVKYAGLYHPDNDCPYREAERCLRHRLEKFSRLIRIVSLLRKNRVPEHAGLMETNMIFRKHNDTAVVGFDRWWWECLVRYSHRDQLTHTLCLLDTPGLTVDYIFPKGICTNNAPGIERLKHPRPPKTWYERKIKHRLNKPLRLLLHLYIFLSGVFYRIADSLKNPAASGVEQ